LPEGYALDWSVVLIVGAVGLVVVCAVFLFPWAVVYLEPIPGVFYEMLIFIAILFFGVVYGWRKGALQWR
jgi:NADH:ubiquinone oxidoreductase subunit 3 (subunit A)